jgi:hypothetical protein
MQKRLSHFGETGTAVFAGEGVEQGRHDVRPRWRARHGAAGVTARSASDCCERATFGSRLSRERAAVTSSRRAARVSPCGRNVSVPLNRSNPVITPVFVIGCMR